jgi:hypothetical protein
MPPGIPRPRDISLSRRGHIMPTNDFARSIDEILYHHRTCILLNFARALDHIFNLAFQAVKGESVFTSPEHLQVTLAVLKQLIPLFPLLPDEPPEPDDEDDEDDKPQDAIHIESPTRPPCPICSDYHWISDCPQRTPDHDVRALLDQQCRFYHDLREHLEKRINVDQPDDSLQEQS